MGTGIIVCGLNGSGKSTLGAALAEKLGFHFIDLENLYFPKTDPNDPYASPRSEEEVGKLLADEIKAHQNFVFAAVRGNYGEDFRFFYQLVVLIDVPKEIRMQRIRNRSFQKFGSRMLPGGDLYEREEAFFKMVESRQENYAENWLESVDCPVSRIDGTRSIEENVTFISGQL